MERAPQGKLIIDEIGKDVQRLSPDYVYRIPVSDWYQIAEYVRELEGRLRETSDQRIYHEYKDHELVDKIDKAFARLGI